MNKHTPGPWDYTPNPYSDQVWEYVCYANGKGSVAQVERHTQNHDDWKDRPREEFEANARLIAAAPEMLEALKLAHKCNFLRSEYPRVCEEIDAAIAKAEGK